MIRHVITNDDGDQLVIDRNYDDTAHPFALRVTFVHAQGEVDDVAFTLNATDRQALYAALQ